LYSTPDVVVHRHRRPNRVGAIGNCLAEVVGDDLVRPAWGQLWSRDEIGDGVGCGAASCRATRTAESWHQKLGQLDCACFSVLLVFLGNRFLPVSGSRPAYTTALNLVPWFSMWPRCPARPAIKRESRGAGLPIAFPSAESVYLLRDIFPGHGWRARAGFEPATS
jgi:hypothetical protein